MTSTRSSSSSRSASFSLPTKDHPVRPGGSSRSRTPSETGQGFHLVTPNPGANPSSGDTPAAATGTGHTLPPMSIGATSANTAANAQRPPANGNDGGEVFTDSDEEMDPETKAKHQEFKGKRKEHYAMEAKLALKRARELMDQDEAAERAGNGHGDLDGEEEGQQDGDEKMEVDEPAAKFNGNSR